MSRKDLPPPSSTNFLIRVREELMRLMGGQGEALDQAMTMRQMVSLGFAQLKQGTSSQIEPKSGSSSGSGGGSSSGGGSTTPDDEPDLTPPPSPASFTAAGLISHVIVEHDEPTYTQGGGHLRTHVYGFQYTGGNLPTFSDAIEIGQFSGAIWAMPSNPGVTWRLWIKWETADGVLSPTPAGGTNGVEVTTGQDVTAMVKAMSGPDKPFTILTQTTTIDGVVYPAGIYSTRAFINDLFVTRAKIADLAVDNSKVANMAVDKLLAGSLAVGQYIQSTGYVPGSAGWRINADGTAELSNAVVRGTVYATNGQFSGTIFGGGSTGYANGIGFFSGETTGYRWRVGNPTGARIQWNGSAIEVYNSANQLTMSSGGTPASSITGLGAFAMLSQLTTANISTYIANAAIGAAQIGSLALVGTGKFNVKSAATGARMEMDSLSIKVFDAAGVLRVHIGNLA